jgi:adenylate cyclase
LILFSYAASHFLNHAFGIRSIDAMQTASFFLLKPWQTMPGGLVLLTAFLTHAALGLYALFRRRHLRIPSSEAGQLALGLAAPILLIPHAVAIAVGHAYGLEFGYSRVLYQYWVVSPDFALPRQYLLVLVLWVHGCIGIRAWLRSKRWYPQASAALAALATLLPVLALLGFTNAGINIREIAQNDPASAAKYLVGQPGTESAENYAATLRFVNVTWFAYLGLLAGTFGFRFLRDWHARRFRAIRVTYPGNRLVTIPLGFSVLEASRWARIPHVSICGGRGRCSTCRIRVVAGADDLAPSGPVEQKTLDRIKAPGNVRLACQVRPAADITVEPLVRASKEHFPEATRFDAATQGGKELEIAALFVDLRESTRLAAERLPYDALFLFDRYIQVVTAAVRENGGYVNGIAGDGVMSVFGAEGNAADAARNGWKAALQIWRAVDALNEELAAELGFPLRIGIGLHVGTAVVSRLPSGGSHLLQFLGNTGNIAAKLEAETKRLNCLLVASTAALTQITSRSSGIETTIVSIAGKEEPIPVAVFRHSGELHRLLASLPRQQA